MKPPNYLLYVMWSARDQCFIASAPELDGCMAHGATRAEAIEAIESLIVEWLESARQLGWRVPPVMTDEDYMQQAAQEEAQQQERFEKAVAKAAEVMREQVRSHLKAEGVRLRGLHAVARMAVLEEGLATRVRGTPSGSHGRTPHTAPRR